MPSPTSAGSSPTAARSTPKRGRAARRSTCPTARSGCIRLCSAKARRACCPTATGRRSCLPCGSSADGAVRLDGAERAIIRSRAKLGYATVATGGFAGRVHRAVAPDRGGRAGARRGARRSAAAGGGRASRRQFRARVPADERDGAIAMRRCRSPPTSPSPRRCTQHGTGLFRVMPEPDERAIRRLRHSAKALGVDWPKTMSLEERERDLDPNDPKQAAFMLAIRRAGAHAQLCAVPRRRAAVAFGDARDLCPCDRAAAAAGRPLCRRGCAGGRQRPGGARTG